MFYLFISLKEILDYTDSYCALPLRKAYICWIKQSEDITENHVCFYQSILPCQTTVLVVWFTKLEIASNRGQKPNSVGLHSKEMPLQSVAVGQILTLYWEGSPGTGIQSSLVLRDRAETRVRTQRDTQRLRHQQKPPTTTTSPRHYNFPAAHPTGVCIEPNKGITGIHTSTGQHSLPDAGTQEQHFYLLRICPVYNCNEMWTLWVVIIKLIYNLLLGKTRLFLGKSAGLNKIFSVSLSMRNGKLR